MVSYVGQSMTGLKKARVEWGKMGHQGYNGSPTFLEKSEKNIGGHDEG